MEYASVAWDPIGDGNKCFREKIEMVQRKSARFVCNDWKRTSSATALVKSLGWRSLESRRLQNRLTFLMKYHQKIIDLDDNLVTLSRSRVLTRFLPIHARVWAYHNSFLLSTVHAWNQLPASFVGVDVSLDSFKKSIANYEY